VFHLEDIHAIAKLTSTQDAARLLRAMAGKAGFDQFFFGLRFPVPTEEPRDVFVSGYADSDEWMKCYEENGFKSADPTIRHALTSSCPQIWTPEFKASSPKSAHLFLEARQFQIKSGITLPVYGPHGEFTMINFVSSEDLFDNFWTFEKLASLHLIASVAANAMAKLVVAQSIHLPIYPHTSLTKREKDCLMWTAEGASQSEIASKLGIALRTVAFHLENARKKLDAKNVHQAVAIAISLKLLQF
jgi:LuxR family transcriptional regulator, quorum-sensing system regulator LasR